MLLNLMFRLAEAYGWSKKDLQSFDGGEVLQLVYKLSDRQEKQNKLGFNGCPMISALKGK